MRKLGLQGGTQSVHDSEAAVRYRDEESISARVYLESCIAIRQVLLWEIEAAAPRNEIEGVGWMVQTRRIDANLVRHQRHLGRGKAGVYIDG
jgi:hypothetical protein